jgi:hypothetical protein
MSLSRSLRWAAAVSVAGALALPALASAHPGVYTVSQVIRPAGATCEFPVTACLTTATQYAVANDGWALGFTEGNGVTGVQADSTAGMVSYKAMPGNWRTPMTPEEKRTYGPAQTDLQPHATCSGSALLDTPANILAWQGSDPFFNYIPWQSASAGVGDEPSKWLPVVKAATGVDLSALADEAAFKAACESAPVSGTYHEADVSAAIATATVAAATAPLQTQVNTLQSQVAQFQNQVTTLQAAKVAADTAAAVAETGRQALADRPLALTLSAKKFGQAVAMVTGVAGTAVTVELSLTAANAKQLKLARRIATKKVTLGAGGAALLTLKPSAKATRAIAKRNRSLKVSVAATGGGRTQTATGTLTR